MSSTPPCKSISLSLSLILWFCSHGNFLALAIKVCEPELDLHAAGHFVGVGSTLIWTTHNQAVVAFSQNTRLSNPNYAGGATTESNFAVFA